jgi:hypothetical protein
LQTSPFWLIVFLIVAALGIVAQYQSTRQMEVEMYDRLTTRASPPASEPAT